MKEVKTKEQLEEEVVELRSQRDRYYTQDQAMRRELARAFGWYKRGAGFGYSEEVLATSWEQIFVEVGKLLSKSLENRVGSLEAEITDIRRTLNEPPIPSNN